ncbi:flavin reductase family protein [Actinophytocola sediminis]
MTAVGEVVNGSSLRDFMRGWATGVAVVTSHLADAPIGCTVNTFTSVSLNPPLVLVSLNETSRTLHAITASQAFGVNILSAGQAHLATHFATASGDRFTNVPHEVTHGIPALTGALAVMACTVADTITLADHVLVFGTPQWLTTSAVTDPAVFFGGRYLPLTS